MRNCLICTTPIVKCHLGIDSCQACSVFYKRTDPLKQKRIRCKRGDGLCMTTEPMTNCRKCRYAKFCEVLSRARENSQNSDTSDEIESDGSESESRLIACSSSHSDTSSSSFIDHSSFFSDEPSCSDTQYLDRIKRGYSLVSLIRKTGEVSMIPGDCRSLFADFDGSIKKFRPGNHKDVMYMSKILAGAVYEFGNVTFSDFKPLSEANKTAAIMHNITLFSHCEATYRAAHHFPNDDTVFCGYTMTFTKDTAEIFLEGSQVGIHKEDVLRTVREGAARSAKLSKTTFLRVAPTEYEFLALLGLSFWNNEVASISDDFTEITERNREIIMKELHIIYKKQGKSDYATRLGDLLCLLDNMQKHVVQAQEDLELYKLMNLFT